MHARTRTPYTLLAMVLQVLAKLTVRFLALVAADLGEAHDFF
ncbi:Unannotated [Lentimonas sp. CC19]|nr:Unannotated [Lentimonas sp. CC4]CAA6687337.1 Unannotated [Lentimonas sp. CC6]CAA6694590.1 Unannotated [Lentimonas sp. CC19]CAA6696552.1 Unannotated [Lentimonas sp. CC10]CAA7071379.1 Unannotated [Lentimonas sp. CC11]CAA7171749.1 Unannotated [Lentimonas sp. CC21]CAA7183551.1 Unannotated [Lentimonas sp. CC8]